MARKKRKKRAGLWQTPKVLAPAEATDALPGSAAKIEDLRERVLRGESLFAEKDTISDPTRRTAFSPPRRNGQKVNLGTTEEIRPDPGEKPMTAGMRYYSGLGKERMLGLEIRHNLAAQLKTLRENKRWTQGQLAYQSGVSQPAISRLETGDRDDACLRTLLALADALTVGLDELVGRQPPRAN